MSERSMSPDWSPVPTAIPFGDLGNPQSFNLFTYAFNNPLRMSDLTGHDPCGGLGASNDSDVGGTQEQIIIASEPCEDTVEASDDVALSNVLPTGQTGATGLPLFTMSVYTRVASGGGGGSVPLPAGSAVTYSLPRDVPNKPPPSCFSRLVSNGQALALASDLVGDIATGVALANPASTAAILIGAAATSVGTINAMAYWSNSGGAVAGVNQTAAATGVLTHGLEIGSFIRTASTFSKVVTRIGVAGSVASTYLDVKAAIATCRSTP